MLILKLCAQFDEYNRASGDATMRVTITKKLAEVTGVAVRSTRE